MVSGPILAPIDFSDCSEAALVWAAELASHMDRELVILHVVHDPEDDPGFYHQPSDDKQVRTLEERASRIFEDYLDYARSRYPVLATVQSRTEMIVGLPAHRIVEVAEKLGAGHIVMGSLGRTGLAHLLVGSVAQRVIQLAPMPVTIVKPPQIEAQD